MRSTLHAQAESTRGPAGHAACRLRAIPLPQCRGTPGYLHGQTADCKRWENYLATAGIEQSKWLRGSTSSCQVAPANRLATPQRVVHRAPEKRCRSCAGTPQQVSPEKVPHIRHVVCQRPQRQRCRTHQVGARGGRARVGGEWVRRWWRERRRGGGGGGGTRGLGRCGGGAAGRPFLAGHVRRSSGHAHNLQAAAHPWPPRA